MKIFLERGEVNPDSPDQSDQTPLSHAAGSGNEGVVNLLLERGDVNTNSLEEELALVSQQHFTIFDTRYVITEVVPLSPSGPSSNQLDALPSASILPSMPTSNPTPDPEPAPSKPSRPPKRDRAPSLPLRRSKRKRFPPS